MNEIEMCLSPSDVPLLIADRRRVERMPHQSYVSGSDPFENTEVDSTSPF